MNFIHNWNDYISTPKLFEYIKNKITNFSKDGIDVRYSFGVDKRKLVSGTHRYDDLSNSKWFYLKGIRTHSPYAKKIYYVSISANYKFYFLDEENKRNFRRCIYFFPMSDNMIFYFINESVSNLDFGGLYDSPNENKWKTIEVEKFIELIENPIRIKKP